MSVDSFYFCSDLDLIQRWWGGPIAQTADALRGWRLFDERDQLGLFDQQALEEDVVPILDRMAREQGAGRSLGEIFQGILGLASEGKRSFLGRRRSGLDEKALSQLAYIASFHSAFAQVARVGPVTETADTAATEVFFVEFLERFMPPTEAARYNGSDQSNLAGPLLPPELETENPAGAKLIDRLEKPYRVNAADWAGRWARLDGIAGLWDQLATEGVSEMAISHLRGILPVARYAVDNQLAMLKMYV